MSDPYAFASLVIVQIVHDHPHRQPEELVDLPHPLGVAFRQIIVHRHHVNAVPGQRVQIARQRRHQRLAFAGLHFGNLALVQHHAADQLHVKVPHVHRAPSRLAHHCKRLGQNLVQSLLFRLDPGLFVASIPSSAAAIRARNSAVFARSCSSLIAFICGSSALISARAAAGASPRARCWSQIPC